MEDKKQGYMKGYSRRRDQQKEELRSKKDKFNVSTQLRRQKREYEGKVKPILRPNQHMQRYSSRYIGPKIQLNRKLRNNRSTEMNCVAVITITVKVSNKKTDVSKVVQNLVCNTLHVVVDYPFVMLLPLKC